MRNFVPKQLRYRLRNTRDGRCELWPIGFDSIAHARITYSCGCDDCMARRHCASEHRKVRFGTGRCPFPWREKACLFNASRNTEIVRVSGWYACEQPVLENRLSSSRLSLGRTKFVSGNEIPKLLYFNGGCTETPVRFRATRSSSSLEEISGRRNSGSVSKVKRFPGWKAHISKEMKRFMEI